MKNLRRGASKQQQQQQQQEQQQNVRSTTGQRRRVHMMGEDESESRPASSGRDRVDHIHHRNNVDEEEEEEEEQHILQSGVGGEEAAATAAAAAHEEDEGNERSVVSTSSSRPPQSNVGDDDDDDDDDGRNERNTPVDVSNLPPLYKSRRFKGYLTIFLASIINYNAALLSNEPLDRNAAPASSSQRAYAMAVSLVSAIVTGCTLLIHMDRYSPLENMVWKKIFHPKSHTESALIFFLFVWWSIATFVQTSVRGVAGDAKEQYNLFYSIWVCLWTITWIVEQKAVDFGYPAFRTFVMSWPFRAPGWIAILLIDFFTLWWYVDLFNNTKRNPERIPESLRPLWEDIPRSQYQWLLFISAITLVPTVIFVIIEILRSSEGNNDTDMDESSSIQSNNVEDRHHLHHQRHQHPFHHHHHHHHHHPPLQTPTNGIEIVSQQQDSRQPKKQRIEIVAEGLCLLCLTLMWVPSVIAVTTPGGFASQIGNAYFCTWITTFFVLETLLWFIHDWRKSVFDALAEKEAEYRRHQEQVMENTFAKLESDIDDDDDDDDAAADKSSAGDDASIDYYLDSEIDETTNHDDENSINHSGIHPHISSSNTHTPSFPSMMQNEEKDDLAMRELHDKEKNRHAYFDTLEEDILE